MAKAFFGILLLFTVLLGYWIYPHSVKRSCPVCLGTGVYQTQPIGVRKGKEWVAKTELLCPFCSNGQLTLYDLRERRSNMLRWMIHEQKLAPEVLVARVQTAWGSEGLEALHRDEFFMKNSKH